LAWPNDVYVRGRKLAGVLVEAGRAVGGASFLAVGIGVNCLQHAGHFPAEIRERATSLEIESHSAVSREEVAIALLRRLDERLAEAFGGRDESLSQRWREHSGDIGRRAELVHGGRRYAGTVVDIDPSHGIWLQLDDGGRMRFDPLTTHKAV
jgi:BirA family biotin operon repressor/biotin-[acetyl-CoA-carboxylase] ligase